MGKFDRRPEGRKMKTAAEAAVTISSHAEWLTSYLRPTVAARL
jgi:hypothetical protein